MSTDATIYNPPGRFVRFWRAIGGGSLTLSIAIHVGILMVAGLVVFVTQIPEKQVDFIPCSGSQ